jgi:hypothetical protein
MAEKSRNAAALAEELRATQAALLGPPRCAGCKPECRDFVRAAIDTALEHDIRVSLGAIHALAVKKGLYRLEATSLRKHITEHEGARWRSLKEAGLVRSN